MAHHKYVHGYSARESERLADQAQTLTGLLHDDTRYPDGARVLEAGCGIGAQTVILARNSPNAYITSLDISEDSIKRAEEKIRKEGITNVTFRQGGYLPAAIRTGKLRSHLCLFRPGASGRASAGSGTAPPAP